jgi:hypothetical protein
MINKIDLYQQLLEDPTYKEVTKELDDEKREALEEYMKDFMEKMQSGLLDPFAMLAGNAQAKKEFQQIWNKKNGKQTLGSMMKKK